MDEITTHEGDRIKVAELSWLPLEFLLFNLDAADRRELFGQCPSENPLEIAYGIMHASKQLGWTVVVSGRPLARSVCIKFIPAIGRCGRSAAIMLRSR